MELGRKKGGRVNKGYTDHGLVVALNKGAGQHTVDTAATNTRGGPQSVCVVSEHETH